MSAAPPALPERDERRSRIQALNGGLVVGFRWWGVAVDDMARQLRVTGVPAAAFPVWDIRRRSHRLVMEREPAASWSVSRRLRRAVTEPGWSVVTAAHRLTGRDAQLLAQRGPMVILLADDPVGRRQVDDAVWKHATVVASPEPSWLGSVPSEIVQRPVFGWGTTITDADLLSAAPYEPVRLLVLGAAYPERVEMANRLAARFPLTVQGHGWEGLVPGAEVRPAAGRMETLRAIRAHRELVINVHHEQFVSGRNPQFFDFASAAIPQVVVFAHDLGHWHLGFASGPRGFDELDLSARSLLQEDLIESVRGCGTFTDTIAEALA